MNRLKELRKEKGLTQKELADEIGTTKLTVSNWENEKHVIRSDKAQVLADFFGVSVGYLLGYSDISKQYDDEQFYQWPGVEPFPYSDKQQEDEKELHQLKSFVRFLIDNGIFLTNNEIDINFKMIKLLDANNSYNGGKYLIRGVKGEQWLEYKNGIYSNILNPSSEFARSDLEKEIDAYIHDETHKDLKYSTEKAEKLLEVLKSAYGERNYLDD